MKRWIFFTLSFLMSLPSFSAATHSGPVTLTLQDCVEKAIQSATIVLKAKNNVDFTGVNLWQSYAQFLPNLTATAGYTYAVGKVITANEGLTNTNSKNASEQWQLATDLNLFNGFADISGLRSSQAQRSASQLNLERAEQQIALDVAQSFLQVILDQQIEDIQKSNFKASTDRLALFTAQKKVGSVSLADLYRQEALTAADKLAMIQAVAKTKDDLLFLIRKIRSNTEDSYVLQNPNLEPKNNPLASHDESQLIELAIAHRPDLASTRRRDEAYGYDINVAGGSYFPKLDFVGTYGSAGKYLYTDDVYSSVTGTTQNYMPSTQDSLNSQLGSQTQYTLGLTLTWTIFDRLVTTSNVAKAREQKRDTNVDLEDLKNQVVSDVKQALIDYNSAHEQLDTSLSGLASAQKAYDTINGRYKVGISNFIDLATAQTALVQAEAQRAQAMVNYYLQGQIVSFVTGNTPLEGN